ncbi:MAG: 5'-nucleotidase C-terminal domain-containing protein [Candidatus Izemoplasmatales bacterium]
MKRILILLLSLLAVLSAAGCGMISTTTTVTTATTSAPTSTTSTLPITGTVPTSTGTTTTETTTTTAPTSGSTVSTTTAERYQTIELFSMNDVHGGAYYTSLSYNYDAKAFSKAAALLANKQENEDDVIVLASGDMFQGTALSNYYYGRPLLEVMNYVGFDAFTIGNHEFDWGIDKIAAYADGNTSNGEADFPFLAANIVSVETGEPMPWTRPYAIVDVNGVKVGIIGVIGAVINSISASRVVGYEFLDAADTVAEYAEYLRTTEGCRVIVASIHEYSSATNNEIANLTGNRKVDAIFNGHSHTSIASSIVRSGTALPFAQTSSYPNSLIAKITLVYDRQAGQVSAGAAEIIGNTGLTQSAEANAILAEYETEPGYVEFVGEALATAQYAFSSSLLAPWGASAIRDYAGVDIGAVNAGGFRVTMEQGTVTMGDMITIYPFDNYIKTCEMTGAQITAFYESVMEKSDDVVFDDGVGYSYGMGLLTIDGMTVDPDAWYTVGAVDYIFDKTYYDFLDGRNITTTSFLIRDFLVEDLRNHTTAFNPANGTAFPTPVAWFPAIRKEDSLLV